MQDGGELLRKFRFAGFVQSPISYAIADGNLEKVVFA